jgi:hypothetical protein
MEPRGCNRWQPVANAPAEERPEQAETVAVGCDRLRKGAHGKGRVDSTSFLLERGSLYLLRKKRQVPRTRGVLEKCL